MGRTRPTGITTSTRTSSGFGGEDFKGPEDLSDVTGIETEIPRGQRTPSPRLPSSPSPRPPAGGIDLSKPGEVPFGGMEPKRGLGRSPIGLEVGKSAGGGLGIGISVPIGGPISARGGVNIGQDGAIKGGQVGLGVGAGPIGASIDVGTDQDERGRGGCYQYVTVTLGPFSHTYGRNVCESPTPTPTPTPTQPSNPPPGIPPAPSSPDLSCSNYFRSWKSVWTKTRDYYNYDDPIKGNSKLYDDPETATYEQRIKEVYPNLANLSDSEIAQLFSVSVTNPTAVFIQVNKPVRYYYYVVGNGISWSGVDFVEVSSESSINYYATNIVITRSWHNLMSNGRLALNQVDAKSIYYARERIGWDSIRQRPIWNEWQYTGEFEYILKCADTAPSPSPSPSPSPTYNPPPRKKMNNECCKILALYHQEQLRLMGRPLGPQGQLIPIPQGTFFETETERIKTPINNIADPEKETIKFNNFYELLMYGLKQQINLDIAVDPQSFVAPAGKIQNPSYERDSETSLESNAQPEEDKKGNKRELTIGEDIKINSIAQQQQYFFEALKRFEYLFPCGELADAKFDKSLIIPGATGELQVHNLIHFSEFLIQFLNSTLGNPKIPVKIEDNNALKDGKQQAAFNHFSISQMIRELYRTALESGDDINSLMETTIRDFRTNLANRLQIVQIAEMVQALVEDSGMLESQEFISVKLDGDPYAGKWKAGMGFEPDADLDSNTEAATEKLMKATLNNFEAQVKVIRRSKRENADIRDLLMQLAEMFIRSNAIPATKEGIEKALAAARYKVRVDNAISRSQIKRAAAAKLSRTRKKKK